MKTRSLPSLNLFRSFETAARCKSFTLAAEELCLTQSAVSRQIRALEDHCGVPLFRRLHKRVELTPEGTDLYVAVSRGLEQIADCWYGLQPMREFPEITVSAWVTLSYFWLMPRLESFSQAYPEIDLRILASDQTIDLHHGKAEIALVYDTEADSDTELWPLWQERIYPVCSPGYFRQHPDMHCPADLLHQTLLHFDGGGGLWLDWPGWFAAQGISSSPARRGMRFNGYPMVLHAAQADCGLGLGWGYIADGMVRDGRLVAPVDAVVETGAWYSVAVLKENVQRPGVSEFIHWLIAEVARG